MPVSPWTYKSAADLAAALSAGQVSAVELARDAIARIEACDSAINAVCVRDFEAGLEAAREADARLARGERAPLLGVPMTIKESFNLAGTPTTWGIPEAREFRPAEDALAVQRVKSAGGVILAKTNVPIGLADWQSYNEIYGVANNPYDLSRSPGGSSGGASAALAAGYGPVSLGSDIGGSLRVPAHFCGVFAHKPTLNLAAMRGHTPPGSAALPISVDLSVIGPMARTAEDLETLLDVIAGPDELEDGVGYKLALPGARHDKIRDFRVLVLDTHPLAPTEDCIVEAIRRLGEGLEKLGAKVARQTDLLPDLASASSVYMRVLSATFSARLPDSMYVQARARAAAQDPSDRSLRAERTRGAVMSYREWSADLGKRLGLRARWRALFKSFDAVICPVSLTPAFPHDHSPDQENRRVTINGKSFPYVDNLLWPAVATLPGLPATALPIGRSPDGLPIGAQIIGPWLEDRTPLQLARLIEREFGGFEPPPAFAG